MIKRVLLLLLAIWPSRAAAQTTGDQILYACYIPAVGVVYRIKAPGLPTACLGKPHVEFHWDAQGPKGDRGEPGPAGNLGLAGQECPTGFWLAGFTPTGALRCRNLAGAEPTNTPPPPPPNALTGTWTLAPLLTSRCTSIIGSGSISVTGMATSVSAANQLIIEITGSYEFAGISRAFVGGGTSIAISDPRTFPIGVSLQGTSTLPGPVSGTVTYDVTGQISGSTSFSGSADISVNNLTVHDVPLPGQDVHFLCDRMTGDVTATRVP
jgi:hypothetical protein